MRCAGPQSSKTSRHWNGGLVESETPFGGWGRALREAPVLEEDFALPRTGFQPGCAFGVWGCALFAIEEAMMPSSCTRVFVHLVWATWRREPLIGPDVEDRIRACISSACAKLRCEALVVGGVADHVHVLVRMHSTVSVAALAKELKGSSSHLVTHEVTPDRFFRWQATYGAFSVSAAEVEAVVGYIRGQRRHHATGSARADWEACEDQGP